MPKDIKFKKLFAMTLVEALVALFIFSVLIAGIFGLTFILYRTKSYEWEQSLAIAEARRGVEKMVREIREAREGENGAYPIEYAGDKEFIFYSDVDDDGKVERVRYFLGQISSQTQTKECQTSQKGGSCSVSFSDFLGEGELKSAKVSVSVDGDFGAYTEYAEIFADGEKIGEVCRTSCKDCKGTWQGTVLFDVTDFAKDNFISFLADASKRVDPLCPFSMKAKFDFSFTQEIQTTQLKRGVIDPVGDPPSYPQDEEKVSIITNYVRNAPPIFEYFDKEGNKIEDFSLRLKNTRVVKIFLVVNVNPQRPPTEYQIETFIHLRNLKKE